MRGGANQACWEMGLSAGAAARTEKAWSVRLLAVPDHEARQALIHAAGGARAEMGTETDRTE